MSVEESLNLVSQPIELFTEHWLMGRAHAAGVDAAVAANALSQLGLGKHCESLRKAGDYFESPESGSLAFELADGKTVSLTSDMLFELLLFAAPSEPRLVPLLCGALGLFPEGRGLLAQPPRPTAQLLADADPGRMGPQSVQQHAITRLVHDLIATGA
ncbi:MAG: hypothetical protein ABI321_06865 [Polyangia bacterium]